MRIDVTARAGERGRARIGLATEDLGGLWCCPETGQFFCGWKGPRWARPANSWRMRPGCELSTEPQRRWNSSSGRVPMRDRRAHQVASAASSGRQAKTRRPNPIDEADPARPAATFATGRAFSWVKIERRRERPEPDVDRLLLKIKRRNWRGDDAEAGVRPLPPFRARPARTPATPPPPACPG